MSKDSRATNIEKERRVRTVLSWILNDALTHEIIEQCSLMFDVKARMANYYIKEARKRIREIEDKDIEEEIDIAVAQRKKLIRALDKKFKSTPEGLKAQLSVYDSISKLKGHWVQKVDVTSKGQAIEEKKAVIMLPDGTKIEI